MNVEFSRVVLRFSQTYRPKIRVTDGVGLKASFCNAPKPCYSKHSEIQATVLPDGKLRLTCIECGTEWENVPC